MRLVARDLMGHTVKEALTLTETVLFRLRTIIRSIEATPLKNNRNGAKDTASFPLTLGA